MLTMLRSVFFQNSLAETALASSTKDRPPSSFAARLVAPHFLYASGSRRQVRRAGFALDLDLSDLVEWHVFYQFHEPSLQALLRLCEPGMTALDVGANIGFVQLSLAKKIGEKGQVIGFEPSPDRFAKCFEHVKNNQDLPGLAKMKVEHKALGSRCGRVTIETPNPRNLGMNRVVETAAGEGQAELMKLDDYILTSAIPRVDLIKIDVEGFEARVLEGAEKTISRDKPKLFVEIVDLNLKRQGSSGREVVRWLEEHGYRCFDSITSSPLTAETDFTNCHLDLIAAASQAL